MSVHYPRVAQLRTAEAFGAHLNRLGVHLPFDADLAAGPDAPLAQPYALGSRAVHSAVIGNRFSILPMEGWDGTPDGKPSDLTRRRWRRFGLSGAKLIWGGEAVAVRPDGRANPNQLMLNAETESDLASLREELVAAHRDAHGATDDLLIGLQLTHSGRFARPNDKRRLEPQVLYAHPWLDRRFQRPAEQPPLSDAEIDGLVGDFVAAAGRAQAIGFDFVDLKHCHGYLGHEFLSARGRPGRYGGSFENRTRFLRETAAGIRRDAPGLGLGVRLSAFDLPPFAPGADGLGAPEVCDTHYPYAFGADPDHPLAQDLDEPARFLQLLQDLDIRLVCLTAGSPYYNPHVQRPALFPPSDGYQPPEDPLIGCARQIEAAAALKQRFPEMIIVGTAYSYFQEYLPHDAQWVVRSGRADAVGIGRMALAYPTLPRDTLRDGLLNPKSICRTFSDCTTGPRNGLVSGCYPLDAFYRRLPEAAKVRQIKAALPGTEPRP